MRATHLLVGTLILALLLANNVPPLNAQGDNQHGLDLGGMDREVNPGDDFFGYANGQWIKTTQIPADRSSYGVFDALTEEVIRQTADLIREASKSADGSEARKVGDYYDAYMDEKAIEERGL